MIISPAFHTNKHTFHSFKNGQGISLTAQHWCEPHPLRQKPGSLSLWVKKISSSNARPYTRMHASHMVRIILTLWHCSVLFWPPPTLGGKNQVHFQCGSKKISWSNARPNTIHKYAWTLEDNLSLVNFDVALSHCVQ